MAVNTNDLAASLNQAPFQAEPMYNFEQPVFGGFKFTDNPEPPIIADRSRSESASRAGVGKAPSSRSKPARKLSMTDTRPPRSAGPRTMSFSQTEGHGLGISLDTHIERPDTVPELYGVPIPPRMSMPWDGVSSVPSILPGSMQSFGTTIDDVVIDR
jgi:hypothetical protein